MNQRSLAVGISEQNLVLFDGKNVFNELISSDTCLYSQQNFQKTISEMHQIFNFCQTQMATNLVLTSAEIFAISEKYLDVLRETAIEGESKDCWRGFSAWSLFHLLYFSQSDNMLIYDLLNWGSNSFFAAESLFYNLQREPETKEELQENDLYWKATVYQLLSFRFDRCATLLENLGFQDQAIEAFVDTLHRMDINWIIKQNNIIEFTKWQKAISEKLASGVFDSNPNILFLSKLLSGDKKVFHRLCNVIVDEWWHVLPLYFAIWHPSAELTQLPDIIQKCMKSFNETVAKTDVFVHILMMNPLAVIQEMNEPQYMAVHLADLLFHMMNSTGTKEKNEQFINLQEIRTFLLTDYGDTLMTKSSMWRLGADYLNALGQQGRSYIERNILSFPIDGELKASQVYCFAKAQGLEESMTMIVNTMFNRYLRRGCWSQALSWSLRGSHSSKNIDIFCNAIFLKATGDEISSLHVLEILGDKLLLSAGLLLLRSYYQFCKCLADGFIKESLELLIVLLKFSTIPSCFYGRMIQHLIEIFSSTEEVLFGKETICEVMSLVNGYLLNRKAESPEDKLETNTSEQLRVLQSLLSQAHLKAIISLQ